MRRFAKWLLLGLLGVVVAAVLAWQLMSGWGIDRARQNIERALSGALHQPVRVRVLAVSWWPLRARLEGFEIGPEGSALRVGSATAVLAPADSLRQLRPVAEIEARDVWVDVGALLSAEAAPAAAVKKAEMVPLVPFRLRRVRVEAVRVRIPYGHDDVMDFTLQQLDAGAAINRLTHHGKVQAAATELHILHRGEDLRLDSVRANAGLTSRGVSIKALDLHGDGISITGGESGVLGLQHRAHAEVSINSLRVLADEIKVLGGRGTIDATLTGSLLDPDGEAHVTVDDFTIRGRAVAGAVGELTKKGRVLAVSSLKAQGLGGALDARAQLTIKGPGPYEIEAAWHDVEAALVTDVIHETVPLSFSTEGHATLAGTVDPGSIDAHGGGAFHPHQTGQDATWKADVRFAEKAGGHVEVVMAQGEINDASGEVTIGTDDSLSGDARVHIADTTVLRSLLQAVTVPPAKGWLEASAQVSGTLDRPSMAGQLSGENVQSYGVLVDRADGAFTLDPDTFRMPQLSLATNGGTVSIAGTFALDPNVENDWTGKIQDVSAELLTTLAPQVAGINLPLWRGTIAADVSGRGRWAQLELAGEASVQQFRLWTEPFDTLSLTATARWPQWDAEIHLQHMEGERLDGAFNGRGLGEVKLSLQSTEWKLERLRGASLEHFDGAVTLGGEVHGPLQALSGDAAINTKGMVWQGRRFGDATVTVAAEKGEWQIQSALLGNAVQVRATVGKQPGWPYRFDCDWRDASIGALLADDPALAVLTSGSATLTGRLNQIAAIDGDLRIDSVVIERDRYRLATPAPVLIRAQQGQLAIGRFVLEGGGDSRVQVAGTCSTDGDVHLNIEGQGDLALAELLVGAVKSSRGMFHLVASVDRSNDSEITLAGNASVSDGAFDVGLPMVFTELYGKAAFAGQTVRIGELSGRTGGGWFTLGGFVDVTEGPSLVWSLTEVSTGFPDWLEHQISGKGTVNGAWDELTIAGDVDVLRVLYDKRIAIIDFLPFLQKKLSHPPSRGAEPRNIRLDLHVKAPGDVFIDNNVAKIELRLDLRVGGTVDDVVLAGPIEALSGQVTFRDRIYEVTSAVVEFRPELGLDPYMNINAETVIKTSEASYTVTVQIAGTADDYRVELGSDDPALSRTDLVSLMTFGKTAAQLQQGGGGVSTSDVIALGAGLYEEEAEQGVKRFLRVVDRVKIESAVSQTTGTFEPRVTIGKDFTENLTATVSSTFGVESRRSVGLEYRLTPRISLLASWESETSGQAGAFGGGVKFHYEYRRLPRFSLLPAWVWKGANGQ